MQTFLFFFHVCAPKGGLAETMETGDTYCNMTSTYSKDVELFRNRSVYKFYCLKVLFTLEQVNTSVVKNKKESLWAEVQQNLRLISLEQRPLIFVYLIMHTQSTQKQIIEYDIKSKYPEEYSTIDKVKCEKLSVRKSCFV